MAKEPVELSSSLHRLLGHLGAPKASTIVDVFDRWNELVGAEIAQHSRPVSFADQVLVIAVDDPAWASQLRWAEKELLERIQRELGSTDVGALDIRVR